MTPTDRPANEKRLAWMVEAQRFFDVRSRKLMALEQARTLTLYLQREFEQAEREHEAFKLTEPEWVVW